jgi:hypothetical protein
MTHPFELNPNENVLFEGDASLLKSVLGIVQGKAIGTNQRFVFHGAADGPIMLQKADIQSAEEAKHGFATKWVVKTTSGQWYQFQAANMAGLRRTMLTLIGQEALAQSTYKQPELSAVRNGTAWLAAFGPTISGVIAILVAYLLNGGIPDHWSTMALLKIFLLKLVLIHLFMRIDHLNLQSQGFNVQQLGIPGPTNIFMYLFSRAKAFGHGKGYAITWCVTFAIEVIALLA